MIRSPPGSDPERVHPRDEIHRLVAVAEPQKDRLAAEVVAPGAAHEVVVDAVDPAWPSIPYGRPIDEARYHVLDAGLGPCPIGVAGDLYIGGGCLCVGYAGQPGQTAEQLLPDPFSGRPGARLYRTGDQARFWQDGILEFLCRLDHQVNVLRFLIYLF